MTDGPEAGTCFEASFDGVAEMPRQLRLLLACGMNGDLTINLSAATAGDLARVIERGLAADQAMQSAASALDAARAALGAVEARLAQARRMNGVAIWSASATCVMALAILVAA